MEHEGSDTGIKPLSTIINISPGQILPIFIFYFLFFFFFV